MEGSDEILFLDESEPPIKTYSRLKKQKTVLEEKTEKVLSHFEFMQPDVEKDDLYEIVSEESYSAELGNRCTVKSLANRFF